MDGVEPVYPQDLGAGCEKVQVVKASDLAVSAVNVNVKGEAKFRLGSFTNPDAGIRREAIHTSRRRWTLAADLGTDMVSVCPLIDGWDNTFQVDYRDQWRWMIEAFGEACAHRSDVRICIEYKPYEVRNHIVLPNMGRTLYFCDRGGR